MGLIWVRDRERLILVCSNLERDVEINCWQWRDVKPVTVELESSISFGSMKSSSRERERKRERLRLEFEFQIEISRVLKAETTVEWWWVMKPKHIGSSLAQTTSLY